MAFILARKVKMSQMWKDETVIPVTVLFATPNAVSLVRNKDKDGYDAVQVRFNKALREFRSRQGKLFDTSTFKVGDEVRVESFKEGDKIRVSGISKGKGFQGVVKRHGFSGGPKTHGQKNRHRAPGSIGNTTPQRVIPGRRMAGHMGMERVTVKNVEVVGVDKEKNLLFLKGAVPGMRGSIIEVSTI